MRSLILLALISSALFAAENNPYLVKHDTTAHIVAGSLIGGWVAYVIKENDGPVWLQYTAAFAVPCLLGQFKERVVDDNYSGKDASSWVLGGVGACAITATMQWEF